MRKTITLIVLMLSLFTGKMLAQPDVDGQSFKLQCARGYVYFNGNQLAGTSSESNASEFAIVTYEGSTYLFDATQQKFVVHTTAETAGGSGNPALESDNDFSKIVKNISFGNTEISSWPYYMQEDEFGNWLNMDGSPLVYFNTWKDFEGGNGGNTYNVIPQGTYDVTDAVAMLDAYFNPSATVKYVISDANGVVYTSEELPATVGQTISDLPASLKKDFCTYEMTEATLVAGENTIEVTVSYELPFETSTSFDDAIWYYLTIRGSKYVRADENNKDSNGRYTTSTTNGKTDEYKWAFIGNPYTNFTIINKGAGEGKHLHCASAPTMSESDSDTGWGRWCLYKNKSNVGASVGFLCEEGGNYYLNDAGGGGNLGYWNNVAAINDGGSAFTFEKVPDATVNVTYEFWVDGEKINTVVEEEVGTNSEPVIPSNLTDGYSPLGYDFTTEGTIGTTDCTITVTGTLKDGVVTDVNDLSNDKAYTLVTKRGSLGTNGTQMVSTNGTSYEPSTFAIINYEDNLYLYSIADSKFVANTTQPKLTDLTDDPAIAGLVLDPVDTKPLFFMGMGSNGVNIAGGYGTGIVVNNWTTRDDGNQYAILASGEFDVTDALAALEEYFHPSADTQFAALIEQLEALPFGTGLNEYSTSVDGTDKTEEATALVAQMKSEGYTEDNLALAQALLDGATLNMPEAGFYRIKGKTSGKYLASGSASNGKFNMSDATDDSTIFCFDGTQLINYETGMVNGMSASSWNWVYGDGAASTVTFQDGLTNGGYGILSNNANFYDNGDASNSADRGGNVTITPTLNARYTSWYLEEVTELTIKMTEVDGKYYATFCAPVDIAEITGAELHKITVDGDYAKYAEAEMTGLPANTGVLLIGTSEEATATIGEYIGDVAETGLSAQIASNETSDGLFFGIGSESNKLGFYVLATGMATGGFKAYIASEDAGAKDGLELIDDTITDGIDAINNSQLTIDKGDIYNLQGQKVTKAQKGVFIQNGKKVVVK